MNQYNHTKPFILLTTWLVLILTANQAIAQIQPQNKKAPLEKQTQIKNIDEFIMLFNFAESANNEHIINEYREQFTRKEMLEFLFNQENQEDNSTEIEIRNINTLKSKLIEDLVSNNYLFNRDTNLYSIARCLFTQKGKDIPVNIYLKYVRDANNSYRWAIVNVESDSLKISDTYDIHNYIPPNNDNLDFISFSKLLTVNNNIRQHTCTSYEYSLLSVFLYLVEKNHITFKQTNKVSYMYLGIPGWKVYIDEFIREGYFTGWLISNIEINH